MKPSRTFRGRRRRRATLTGRYQRLIRACEALKENRPNSDKTWVEKTLRAFCEHYARVQRGR